MDGSLQQPASTPRTHRMQPSFQPCTLASSLIGYTQAPAPAARSVHRQQNILQTPCPAEKLSCSGQQSSHTSCWHAGYCQTTCGRCPCCQTVSQVLAARGLTSFLAALQATPLGFQLAQPGFMATVLAPSNAAFTTFLKGEAEFWGAHCGPWGMQALALQVKGVCLPDFLCRASPPRRSSNVLRLVTCLGHPSPALHGETCCAAFHIFGRYLAMGVPLQFTAGTFWHVSCHLSEHRRVQQTGWPPEQRRSSAYAEPHV